MPFNDRWNAVEGQTVRLYFRNYVSNVLTDVTGTLSVQIRQRGSTTVLATPQVFQEDVGTYYVEWAIPSSNPNSLKFDPNFPGPGDYQDVWFANGTPIHTQDFYVSADTKISTLAKIREPLVFQYDITPTRLESGARDYVTLTLTERNNQLTTNWPEGQYRIWRGDQVILNYTDLIHKDGEGIYRFFLNTDEYEPGLYKIQFKFDIPEETIELPATLTFENSLSAGYTPVGVGVLRLNIDGVIRSIDFPSNSTPPSMEATPPTTLNFSSAHNDVLYVNVGGTDRTIRLPRTPLPRTITELANELDNGTVPSAYSTLSFPLLTSYQDLTSVPTGIDGTTLKLRLDGNDVTVTFSSISSVSDIVAQIDSAVFPGFANIVSGILVLSGGGTYDTIEVIGGTAIRLLGFVEGQSDSASKHKLNDLGVTVTSLTGPDRLRFTSSSTIKFYSASEGSTANVTLGIDGNGVITYPSDDQPAQIQSDSTVAPFVVELPEDAIALGTVPLPTYYALNNGSNVWITQLDGKSFVYDEGTPVNVTFNDRKINAAIVSPKATTLFTFSTSTTLVLNDGTDSVTVNFPGSVTYTVAEVAALINNAISSASPSPNLVADTFNGLLRISATTNTASVRILEDTSSTSAYQILGFGDVLADPTKPYQNDQVYFDTVGSWLTANPYVLDWQPTDVIDHINDTISSTNGQASLEDGRLKISSTNDFTLSAGAPDALPDLYLVAGTYNTKPGQNYLLDIAVTVGANNYTEQIELAADNIKTVDDVVVDINSKSSLVTASNISDTLIIETIYKGSTVSLTVTDSSTGTLSALNITTNSATGQDAQDAVYETSTITNANFFAGDNAFLAISHYDGTTTISETIDLSGATSPSDVVSLINSSSLNTVLTASYVGGILKIEGLLPGSSRSIILGGLNDGSTANTALGFSQSGTVVYGTDGTPYSLDTIISKINSAYGGYEVARRSGTRLQLNSIDVGAAAKVEVLSGTTADLIQVFGITIFQAYGETTSVLSQTIVSPKINFIIGE